MFVPMRLFEPFSVYSQRALKLKLWACWLGCFCLGATFAEGDALVLMNGDSMKGRLGTLEKGRFWWTPAWSERSLRIPAAYVREIELADPPQIRPLPDADALVSWRNGDEVLTQLSGMEADRLLIRFLPELMVPARLEFLRKIEFLPATKHSSRHPFYYDLPPEEDAWEIIRGSDREKPWTRDALGLHIPANFEIAHEMPELPEKFRMQLLLRQPRENFRRDLRVFQSRRDPPENPSSLLFRFLPSHISILHYDGSRHTLVQRVPLDPGANPSEMHEINLYVNRRAHRFHLRFNGKTLGSWELDPGVAANAEDATSLTLTSSSGDYVFERLRVSSWSEDMQMALERAVPEGMVRVFPWGGDFFDARWAGLDEAGFRFVTDGGDSVLLARDAVAKLIFSESNPAPYRRNARDVQVINSAARAQLTFALESWDGAQLTGESEHWSTPLRLPREWIESLKMNVHRSPGLLPPVSPSPFPSPHQRL